MHPGAVRLARMTRRIREVADPKSGELPCYAWPGGYPLFYVTSGDDVICCKCANDATTGEDAFGDEKISAYDVNWEDPDLDCDECGERIESAYADDDEPDDGEQEDD